MPIKAEYRHGDVANLPKPAAEAANSPETTLNLATFDIAQTFTVKISQFHGNSYQNKISKQFEIVLKEYLIIFPIEGEQIA